MMLGVVGRGVVIVFLCVGWWGGGLEVVEVKLDRTTPGYIYEIHTWRIEFSMSGLDLVFVEQRKD